MLFPLNLGGLVNSSANRMRQDWCICLLKQCQKVPCRFPWVTWNTWSLNVPFQTQLSYWEKSKPHTERPCIGSLVNRPAGHSLQGTTPQKPDLWVKESPDEPGPRPEAPSACGPHWVPRQVWGRGKPSTGCQNSAHIVCEHNKMATDSCYLAIDEWSSP